LSYVYFIQGKAMMSPKTLGNSHQELANQAQPAKINDLNSSVIYFEPTYLRNKLQYSAKINAAMSLLYA
jgi:hypothetical protein